jgi:hypothetical protein
MSTYLSLDLQINLPPSVWVCVPCTSLIMTSTRETDVLMDVSCPLGEVRLISSWRAGSALRCLIAVQVLVVAHISCS